MNKRISTYQLAESAIMLALASAFSFISVFHLPYGGSITLCSMVPLLYLSFRYELKWSVFVAFLYGLLQMLFSFYAPPTRTFFAFLGVVTLDYIVAFGALGLAGFFARSIKGISSRATKVTSSNAAKGTPLSMHIDILFGATMSLLIRFLCHFASGILIWGVYAPEGQSAAVYSFLYNGTFMLGEWVLTIIALVALVNVLPKQYKRSLL